MNTNLGPLFDQLLSVATLGPLMPGNKHEAAFWRFVRANEHIVERLRREALDDKAAGLRGDMKLLWHLLRRDLKKKLVRVEGAYALNNNFTSLMARLLERTTPALVGFFPQRDQERAPAPDPRRRAAEAE